MPKSAEEHLSEEGPQEAEGNHQPSTEGVSQEAEGTLEVG